MVHFKWPLDSMARKQDCLTFGFIIQPNYIADIFELRQLVDLYAETRHTGLSFFLLLKKKKKNRMAPFEKLCLPVVTAGGSLVY